MKISVVIDTSELVQRLGIDESERLASELLREVAEARQIQGRELGKSDRRKAPGRRVRDQKSRGLT